ncbi:hypothetical protein ATANTOWER_023597 [Ataeniobius toweri]|uniref:Uncharacterized protein n=1 Tax=Ataeniobius toweri TaxID=208326 RepID=A0ABU7A7U5_9TELE|nr:hypothetical protein [Ataeniobius toweri]
MTDSILEANSEFKQTLKYNLTFFTFYFFINRPHLPLSPKKIFRKHSSHPKCSRESSDETWKEPSAVMWNQLFAILLPLPLCPFPFSVENASGQVILYLTVFVIQGAVAPFFNP